MIDMEGAGLDELTCKADDQLCVRIIGSSLRHKTALTLTLSQKERAKEGGRSGRKQIVGGCKLLPRPLGEGWVRALTLVVLTSCCVIVPGSVKIRLQS